MAVIRLNPLHPVVLALALIGVGLIGADPIGAGLIGVRAAFAADPAATPVVIRADHQSEDLGRLLDLARERAQEIVVRIEPPGGSARATPAAATAPASRARTIEAWALDNWNALADSLLLGLERGVEGCARLPWLADSLAAKWQDRHNAASSAGAFARIAAVLGGGLVAALIGRLVVLAVLRRARHDPACLIDRFGAAVRGALAEGVGLACFALAAHHLVGLLLPQDDFARFLARDFGRIVVSLGLYMIGARFLLAPGRPEQRLLPIRRPAWHYRMIVLYALSAVFIYATALPVAELGDEAALNGWLLIVSTAILGFKLWWFWVARHDFAALIHGATVPPPLGRRIAGALASWVLIAVAILTWWMGRLSAVSAEGVSWGIAAGFTQVAAALLPILAVGADRLVDGALDAGNADASPLRKAWIAVGRTLAEGTVWVLGFLLLADVWGLTLFAPRSDSGRAALTASITIGVAIVIGGTLWRFASTYLAAHAPRLRNALPGEDDEEDESQAQSRLATALPLVRATILGLVLGLTILIVLSTLGLDIGPLLAGFGVIGLAISFGSQALVRDIMSGIFFMTDDAFRVGEYIDTGRHKGTVEKITLRSVQLRHQSGQVHTIPFGQLQAITNASRDWATVKFNIRLERGTDLEQARKIIKKVGQEMQADPELTGEIILPLKLQGVADITDSAIVCRLKFTAKPARSSWVQREALKRVYGGLEAAGLPFASGAVTVKTADPDRPASPFAAAVPRTPTEEVVR